MLPTSNGAAVSVLALQSAGRVPAMINFSAGAANVLGACRAAQVDTIVTAHAFVEKGRLEKLIAGLEGHVRLVYLEDIRKTVTFSDKLVGALRARRPLVARKPDDWAVILFTSGTEGVPKGVVLSHRNVLSNVAQAEARIDFGRDDRLFMALPAFHSFGFMGGIVLPLISGVPTFFYPSPLHYRTVPELVYGICATYMFGTDTFLAGYARMANPYDFRSLRYIIAGAEPIKETTRRTYLEKFGMRVLEGYGVTEASPVLALNTPMFNKFGTVGRFLPGIEARLEKVEGVDEDAGRLFVKGPNVMLGYLRAEKPGELEPPPEGWYDTGDIVSIDEQGYIAIKGRAKRFAKVGGEMVSLAAVEMLADRAMAELQFGGGGGAGRPQGRAADPGHRQAYRHARRFPGLRPQQARRRTDDAGGSRHRRKTAAARLRQARSADHPENGQRADRCQGDGGGVGVRISGARCATRCDVPQADRTPGTTVACNHGAATLGGAGPSRRLVGGRIGPI